MAERKGGVLEGGRTRDELGLLLRIDTGIRVPGRLGSDGRGQRAISFLESNVCFTNRGPEQFT